METLIPNEHIVATELDEGEGVLVDLHAKRYYQLNETAMLIWQCLEKGCTMTEAANKLIEVYDVTADHAAESVKSFVHDLQVCNLVRSS